MKKLILFILLVSFSSSIFAVSIGAKIGGGFVFAQNYDVVQVPNEVKSKLDDETKQKVKWLNDAFGLNYSIFAGAFLQFSFLPLDVLGIKPEVNYIRRAINKPLNYETAFSKDDLDKLKSASDATTLINNLNPDKATFDFINITIPVRAQLPLVVFDLYAEAGAFVEFLFASKNAEITINDKEIKANKMQYGGAASVGIEFNIPIISLGIDARYMYHASKIWDKKDVDGRFHTLVFSGYAKF
jgi:hypothetical protein